MYRVAIRFTFIGFHKWADAPKFCAFLRDTHRHVFHVEMQWPVTHTDRDIEFITKKDEVLAWVRKYWDGQDLGTMSCEDMCRELVDRFACSSVSVYEDGENGALYAPI